MKEYLSDIIPLFFPVVIFILIFIGIYFSEGKKRQKLKQLAGALAGGLSKFSFTPSFNGQYLGLKFNISLIPANKSTPPYLRIYLCKNTFVELTIRRETSLTGIGKQLGWIKEVKIKDAGLDMEFLALSRKPDIAANYLRDDRIREAIKELFNDGYNYLRIDGKKTLIQKPNYDLEKDLSAVRLKEVIRKLDLLTR